MKRPIIIDGPEFDWESGAEAMDNVMDEDGELNWMAAMAADPGVMKCPECGESLWREGHNVRCPQCSHEWDTRTPQDHRETQEMLPNESDTDHDSSDENEKNTGDWFSAWDEFDSRDKGGAR